MKTTPSCRIIPLPSHSLDKEAFAFFPLFRTKKQVSNQMNVNRRSIGAISLLLPFLSGPIPAAGQATGLVSKKIRLSRPTLSSQPGELATGSNRGKKMATRTRRKPDKTKHRDAENAFPSNVGQFRDSRRAPSASLVAREIETVSDGVADVLLEGTGSAQQNPRSFPFSVKQQCWDKAEKVKGRDPDRWRRDAVGNIVFRKLVGCPGCLCHDYDHIVPYSKGGKSTLENCQVLQATVNRSKGNQTEISRADLIRKSSYCRVSGRDMDLLELSAYGNVRHSEDPGGCRIQ
ncbi:hypothetical protein MLD38_026175 [Melastoma candidum]|uniref:Uncharacterized protein n=1 Tax=Melastoma candidum TaxID=119954 RepID=A0ACB9P4E7_9MYRT|nr:hypothetical protein MLD38_026175 [Melastoma candidum]